MATFEEEYKKYSTSGQGKAVNDLYDAKQQSQLTQLEKRTSPCIQRHHNRIV